MLAAGGAGAAGFASTCGTGERAGAGGAVCGVAACCCCFVISLSTSPGLEICDKSILVLISSDSRTEREARLGAFCASAAARK